MMNRGGVKIPEKGASKVDIAFTILLLCATLSTAFCVYQATRWNGVQAVDFGLSAKFRTESIRATTEANSLVIIDVELFTSWIDAVSKDDRVQADFIQERFRPEFTPAFEAWLSEANATHLVPPGTPFNRPEYSPAKYEESELLEAKATAAFEAGKDANENGDLYISNTVLFAVVLFFCGIYSRWESVKIRKGILVLALIIFSFALYLMVSLLLRVGYV